MPTLDRDGVRLAFDTTGEGDLPIVLVHGIACHRGFVAPQARHLAAAHRVVSVDLRGHGESDAPPGGYTIGGLADDLGWLCGQLELDRPVVVGHSLGGLVALELAASRPGFLRGVVMIDSVLLLGGDRTTAIRELVAGIRGPSGETVLRDYFTRFLSPLDGPAVSQWILEQAGRVPAHVTSSIWEASLTAWDDAAALARCRGPLLYLDAGTPNSDLARAAELAPALVVGRTIGSGHFSQLVCPEQVNAMIDRFLAVGI